MHKVNLPWGRWPTHLVYQPNADLNWLWWYTSINLSTQEVEVGGLWVYGQPGLHSETLPQKVKRKKS